MSSEQMVVVVKWSEVLCDLISRNFIGWSLIFLLYMINLCLIGIFLFKKKPK